MENQNYQYAQQNHAQQNHAQQNHAQQNHAQQNHAQQNHARVQKIMNATIVTGEYFSKKENRNKKSYLTIGKLFIYPNGGMALKLDAVPLGGQVINFYDIKPKDNHNQNAHR